MALRLSFHSGSKPSGVPPLFTGMGVLPVVSMPMPTTCAASNPATLAFACSSAPFTTLSRPSR
jgi:hypothetical protein